MEKFTQTENQSEFLSAQQGLDLLKSSTAKVRGVDLFEFLDTAKGKEMLKTKKIILAGPPQSGKSCLRQGLKEIIKGMEQSEGAPYPYMLTACPDGEGSWFQESMNADPEAAKRYKAEYKQKFTPEHAKIYAEWVKNASAPHSALNFIDIGGVISSENEIICKDANGAIILSGQTAVQNDLPGQWKEFLAKLNIPIVAEIYSDFNGDTDFVEGVGNDGVFRGSIHHLHRGEKLDDRETIQALSRFIVDFGKKDSKNS